MLALLKLEKRLIFCIVFDAEMRKSVYGETTIDQLSILIGKAFCSVNVVSLVFKYHKIFKYFINKTYNHRIDEKNLRLLYTKESFIYGSARNWV